MCAEPNRLFVTADVNQSIHSAGFSWQAVHEDLNFVGRTGILKANHRSTKEITEAARDHLACGVPEDLAPDEQTYVHTDGPLPAVRALADTDEEADLVARYLKGATKDQRLTIGSGAVLVPDQFVGKPLVEALEERGIPAEYKDSRSFELSDNYVTVLPLTSAKGGLSSQWSRSPDSGDPTGRTSTTSMGTPLLRRSSRRGARCSWR